MVDDGLVCDMVGIISRDEIEPLYMIDGEILFSSPKYGLIFNVGKRSVSILEYGYLVTYIHGDKLYDIYTSLYRGIVDKILEQPDIMDEIRSYIEELLENEKYDILDGYKIFM